MQVTNMEHAASESSPKQTSRSALTRNKILDAAVELYLSQGAEATSISDIIKQSGIGRTTLYRHFKDHDAVLNAVMIRDFEQLMADFQAQRFNHDDPAVQIVEDICWFNRQLRARPALALLFADGREQLYARLDLSVELFEHLGLISSKPTFELAQTQGRLREGIDLRKYVEWCTFIIVSLQTTQLPFASNEFELRDTLRDFLVPALIRSDSET